MANAIAHRGPDDSGTWGDAAAGIFLGHRRLSIIDLSAAGHQPMASPCGRYVLSFNGEIYNHEDLRIELTSADAAPVWRGHSDTETLLAGFARWGIAATLAKTVGMFAIAVWDREQRTLTLARDRFGEKPLYFGWISGSFVFGSELKALKAVPGFSHQINREALRHFFRFLYVPAPLSIYSGIFKLEPGCMLSITGSPPSAPPLTLMRPPSRIGSLTLERWWSLDLGVVNEKQRWPYEEQDALDELDRRLQKAVSLQSLADVPLGAFLSGGIDSSTIVAIMQEQSLRPVNTFTVGFEEEGYDESTYARAVAQHLGTAHTEIRVTARETLAVIPKLSTIYDEPFADSSQIPTRLICAAAGSKVKVALSGDAGDELFGGYNRYFWGPSIWSRLSWMPYQIRQVLGAGISAVPVSAWNALGSALGAVRRSAIPVHRVGDKAHKLATRLGRVRSMDDLYLSLVTEWQDPSSLVLDTDTSFASSFEGIPLDDALRSEVRPEELRMMYMDIISYLPDDILCKVDRASMSVSLETRVPFLDHRVAEFAWQLPPSMKIRGAEGKWALRQLLYRRVPRELVERPKAGFGVPVGQWLRGPLQEWAESLLSEERLKTDGFLDHVPIRQCWLQHVSGQRDWTARLWGVLMFQAWLHQ